MFIFFICILGCNWVLLCVNRYGGGGGGFGGVFDDRYFLERVSYGSEC